MGSKDLRAFLLQFPLLSVHEVEQPIPRPGSLPGVHVQGREKQTDALSAAFSRGTGLMVLGAQFKGLMILKLSWQGVTFLHRRLFSGNIFTRNSDSKEC